MEWIGLSCVTRICFAQMTRLSPSGIKRGTTTRTDTVIGSCQCSIFSVGLLPCALWKQVWFLILILMECWQTAEHGWDIWIPLFIKDSTNSCNATCFYSRCKYSKLLPPEKSFLCRDLKKNWNNIYMPCFHRCLHMVPLGFTSVKKIMFLICYFLLFSNEAELQHLQSNINIMIFKKSIWFFFSKW